MNSKTEIVDLEDWRIKMLSKTRVFTAICMVIVLVPFIFLGGYFIYGLCAVLAFIGTYELVKMHNRKFNLPKFLDLVIPLLSSGMVIVSMIYNLVLNTDDYKFVLFGILLIVILLLIISLVYSEVKVTDSFYYMGAILYGGVSFAVVAAIRNVDIFTDKHLILGSLDVNLSGLFIFVYIYFTTIFTDIGAYSIGCRIGKHKLIPSVSPNKSVEGAIGGSICGTLVGTLCLVLSEEFIGFNLFGINSLGLKIVIVLCISLMLTVISQIGDLIASKLKREYEIKDYGNLFPGHGGVMDRFDSVLFVLPTFYCLITIANNLNIL